MSSRIITGGINIQVQFQFIYLKLKKFIYDPLYKNSFFIILNSFSSAFFGLAFWIIAARFYSSEEIGQATALISASAIIGSLSSFGLSTGVIRFLPESKEKSLLFNSVWIILLISSIIFGLAFLMGIEFFSPALKFLTTPQFMIIFVLFQIFQTSTSLGNSGLLALRKAEYSFAQSLGQGFRIIPLIPLAFGGVIGIFGSLGMAYAISSLICLVYLDKQRISIKPVFRNKLIKDIASFSLANYAIEVFTIAQASILPLLILNVIGAKETAHFYIAFSVASLLYAIPNSVFMSMFIEGSHGEPLKKNLIKSLAIVALLTIPSEMIIYFFGDFVLSIFSMEYSYNAYKVLRLLTLSIIFVTFNAMFVAIKRIEQDMKALVGVNALLFISTVIFSYVFMCQYNIIGVGLGWIAGQALTTLVTIIIMWKERKTNNLGSFKNIDIS